MKIFESYEDLPPEIRYFDLNIPQSIYVGLNILEKGLKPSGVQFVSIVYTVLGICMHARSLDEVDFLTIMCEMTLIDFNAVKLPF